ncbi:MAG: V-type ATPase subunit [Enterococcus sp.]
MKTSYHELNPLIRAKETELLSSDDIDRLVKADSIIEVGKLLEPTIYAPYIFDGFEYEFEENLAKEHGQLFDWLKEIAPEPEVVWIYTMRLTFHNLKVLTKAELTNQNLDHLYQYDGFYSLDELKEAIRTTVSDRLPEGVMASIREVKEYLEESAILQGIDVIYDRHFLKEQRYLGEKLGYPELLEEIITLIDLTNLIITARGITQNRSIGFMTGVLSSSGGISKETFLNFVEKDLATFVEFLESSSYSDFLAPALENGTIDLVRLEQMKDDYLTSLFQTAQIQAFGPLPLLAFLNAKEIEGKNLRLIIVGKRSGFPQEEIRKRVRRAYDA